MDNVVTYAYAKFSDDRLWNEKALADRKSDNTKKKNNKKNVCCAWRPVSESKNSNFTVTQSAASSDKCNGESEIL